jgi:hypothetical protein
LKFTGDSSLDASSAAALPPSALEDLIAQIRDFDLDAAAAEAPPVTDL